MASPVRNQKLFNRVTSNPYTPPVGATPEGIRRAEQLQYLRKQNTKFTDGSCPPSLEVYCKVFDTKRPSRRNKTQTNGEGKGLRNAEFLIAWILENEGHATAIPPTGGSSRGTSLQSARALRCHLPLRCHLVLRSLFQTQT